MGKATFAHRTLHAHRRRRAALVLGLVAWVASVGLVAYAIEQVQRDERRQLERRFAIRTDSGTRFIEVYAREVLRRERAQALAQLTRPRVARRQFDSAVIGGGYQAAVLLDSRGHILQVAPSKPSLIGTDAGRLYPHLGRALRGIPAVSTVIPAVSGGASIVAFATPFDSPQGRRVFSGAFDVRQTPLAEYLASVSSIKPSAVDLLDPAGAVVASNRASQRQGLPGFTPTAGQKGDHSMS